MTANRTLTDALHHRLGDDARAFLQAGSPQPDAAPTITLEPAPPKPSPPPPSTPATKPVRETGRSKAPAPSSPGVISVTVRLPAAIGAALLRASLERKLAREEPFSQQDIVTQALTGWLAANGYPVADS